MKICFINSKKRALNVCVCFGLFLFVFFCFCFFLFLGVNCYFKFVGFLFSYFWLRSVVALLACQAKRKNYYF